MNNRLPDITSIRMLSEVNQIKKIFFISNYISVQYSVLMFGSNQLSHMLMLTLTLDHDGNLMIPVYNQVTTEI